MNKLEELSKKNNDNYKKYLKRMTDSIKYSTKGIIPILAKEGKNILDVGCGSGVLLSAIEEENKEAKLTGIDLNINAINNLKNINNNWDLYHLDFMKLKDKKYDTIIFSSILHEISSYNEKESLRFTDKPIKDAIVKSNELLEDNGILIIRDGLLTSKKEIDNKLVVSFTNAEDSRWLYKFKEDFRGFDKLNINKEIIKVDENKFEVRECFLKEFLCTYTWGEESYSREINERFGILSKEEWISIVEESGYKIETIIESKEEYEKYLSKKILIYDERGNKYNYPFITVTIKAKKYKKY